MRISRQQPHPGKLRGNGRALRQAMVDAQRTAAQLSVEPEDWWDLWHFHADWRGRGNLSWRHRRAYLEPLVVVFRRVAELRDRFPTPFQSWIYLSGRDAGEDATYLHTPNPNGTAFPVELRGPIAWGATIREAQLERMTPDLTLRVGLITNHDEFAEPPGVRTSAFICARGVGVPLEGDG